MCHIFPQLKNKVLLSIGQFCDNGFTATFTAAKLHIYRGTTSFLQGTRNKQTGLWYIDLMNQQAHALSLDSPAPSPPAEANNVYALSNKRAIATYLHRTCFSPVPSTWIKPSTLVFSPPGRGSPCSSSGIICPNPKPPPRGTFAPRAPTNAPPNHRKLLLSHHRHRPCLAHLQ